ncbi:rRNA methyltransferase [Alicyclobacillus cellulosilyticus]|uniref:rRNA methyltransferase n=1 Tax=Alicyclobacillus cellulosilyticus TaxID=1003997 RepID=A0A917NKR6_9BACL|nr:rRNA methyltransferase [Alicyclobacillus cellulosilyticus]
MAFLPVRARYDTVVVTCCCEVGEVRIIAGAWRGCRLTAPAKEVARPTTDRVKEAMFNLMGWDWSGGLAVDLFAGSGALGLEALSRGAEAAILVDTDPRSLAAIRENVRRCRAEGRAQVWRMDWQLAWRKIASSCAEVGWVFVDPPYRLDAWERVLAVLAMSPVTIRHGVVCEHPRARVLPDAVRGLSRVKHRAYGDIAVSIYRPVAGTGDSEEGRGDDGAAGRDLPGQL